MNIRLHSQDVSSPLNGLLLDMCNVLYDDTAWQRWVFQLLSHLGLCGNYGTFFHVWQRECLVDVHRGRRDFRDAFGGYLRAVGLTPGQIDEVQAASQARRRYLEDGARPLPGVKTTLARLHQSGIVLGGICNAERSAAELKARLERFGVAKYFATIVSSIDLGHVMPEEACYQTALEAMDCQAAETAFVGHDADQLTGAAAVGMRTVAFNYDTDARADVHLSRFDELLEVVSRHQPLSAAG